MARDSLPCDTDAAFKMACASVSHHARATGGRKFKVADKGTKLFDEAYRCACPGIAGGVALAATSRVVQEELYARVSATLQTRQLGPVRILRLRQTACRVNVVHMYRPEDSRHFRADQSSTFVPQSSQTFDLNYADGSHLRGFSGVDQVYMGDYKATSPFGTPILFASSTNLPDCVVGFCRAKAKTRDQLTWQANALTPQRSHEQASSQTVTRRISMEWTASSVSVSPRQAQTCPRPSSLP